MTAYKLKQSVFETCDQFSGNDEKSMYKLRYLQILITIIIIIYFYSTVYMFYTAIAMLHIDDY